MRRAVFIWSYGQSFWKLLFDIRIKIKVNSFLRIYQPPIIWNKSINSQRWFICLIYYEYNHRLLRTLRTDKMTNWKWFFVECGITLSNRESNYEKLATKLFFQVELGSSLNGSPIKDDVTFNHWSKFDESKKMCRIDKNKRIEEIFLSIATEQIKLNCKINASRRSSSNSF